MKRGVLTVACLMLFSLQAEGAPTIEELIAQSKSSSAAVREQAAAALGEVAAPTEAAIAALIELLEDEEFGSGSPDLGNPISWIARWSLERVGPVATPQLVERLSHSRRTARAAAAQMLGDLRDRRATAPLLKLLDDSEDLAHQSAVRALGHIGDPEAFDALRALIVDGSRRAEWCDVMGAMAACDSRLGQAALKEFARHDDRAIREAAVSVMVDGRDESAIDALLAALDDPDIHVQGAAALALDWIVAARGAEPAVAAFAKKEAYHEVRCAALHALFEANDPRTSDLAIEGLNDASDEVKESALGVLQRRPNPRAFSALAATLRTAEYNLIRAEAAAALASLGDRSAVPALIEALEDASPLGCAYAARALGELGDPAAVEALDALKSQDKDRSVREAAALAVERLRAAAKEESPR